MGDTLRVGLIGANPQRGWAAQAHLPALAALPHLELSAVATTRQASAEETARRFGARHAFTDAHQLIEHPEVDVVAVVVQLPHHDELVAAAVRAGKHVFCEWPLARDAHHAKRLRDLARDQRVHHMVGLQGRCNPAISYVCDLVAQGYLGEVLGATLTQSIPIFGGAQLPPNLAWIADKSQGVNLLSVVGDHKLDALRHCLGEFHEISATTATRTPQMRTADTGETVEVSAPDQVLVHGTLESGALVSVHIQGGAPYGSGARLEIQGTQGALTITGTTLHASELTVTATPPASQRSELPLPDKYRNTIPPTPGGLAGNVAGLYAGLAQAIQTGTPVEPDFTTALSLHQLLDTISKAADTGHRHCVRAR